jgi:hypothetical protein
MVLPAGLDSMTRREWSLFTGSGNPGFSQKTRLDYLPASRLLYLMSSRIKRNFSIREFLANP